MIIDTYEGLLSLPPDTSVMWVQKLNGRVYSSTFHQIGQFDFHQSDEELEEKFEEGLIVFFTEEEDEELALALVKF